MIEPQLAAKHLVYTVALPATPIIVRADHEKLVQILLNLLSNAVKFTGDGGRITVSVERGLGAAHTAAPGTATICVADTGRGIPREKLEAIFEPFVQVRAAHSHANEGTGLGLAISRNLARGMGGELTAMSDLGVGSVFLLSLPLAGEGSNVRDEAT
jgi:signal transduction histidine kinase